jgi:hypothetical protein
MKVLVITSGLMSAPALYALYRGLYFHGSLLLCVSAASMNFWKRPIDGTLRHNVDLIFARLSFCVFFMEGRKINNIPLKMGTLYLVCFYVLSRILHKKKSRHHPTCHVIFHLIAIYCQFATISNIKSIVS